MPAFKQPGWFDAKRGLALLILVPLLILSISTIAQAATTPAIEKAKDQVSALRELVEQLDEQMSAAAEDYNYAAQQLEDTQAAIKKTKRLLGESETDLAGVQDRLNERVVDIYKSGDVSMLSVLLAANSFTDMIGRYEQLQRLGKQDAQLVEQVSGYKTMVSQHKTQLDAELITEQSDVQKTADAKAKVKAQLAKQEKALAGKEALLVQLKAEQAAREKAAAEAARKAAEEAERQAQEEAKKKSTPTTEDGGGSGPSGYDGSRSSKVVKTAMQYIGVPYVWGGASPSGFDCSGLVLYSYAKVGVRLPHSSRMQYNYGENVPRSLLKAGDLVFFFNPIHHVAIYIGGGRMVHASGSRVHVATVWTTSYHGARRIL